MSDALPVWLRLSDDGRATLVPPFPGAEMRYTTDASPPTVTSLRYEGPFETSDPAKLRYVTVIHGRLSPARNGATREPVARWKPADLAKDWKALDFDVTGAITADGVHRACFEFTGGACKLVVRKVELLRNGARVAQDDHEGETGGRHLRNIWRLPVTGHQPGAKYTLRAEVKPDGGTDSSGGISIERASGLEPEVQVVTTIPHYTDNKPENLADWDAGTFFWSSRPLGDGDKVDFIFAQAQSLKHLEVATGLPDGNRDQIQNAVLEVSENGTDFRQVAGFSYGSAKADLDGKPVKAVRFRVTGPHQTWCVLRDLVLK